MRRVTTILLIAITAPLWGKGLYQPKDPQAVKKTHETYAAKYAIASQGSATSAAGRKMFELGGNAIDAAAAVSFAISVERPQSTGIGGGGFMLIHFAKTKETIAVDFREKAPLKGFETMYQDPKTGDALPQKSRKGILAAGVPGLVAGVLAVQKKYGRLSRKQVLQPAIDLAEKGFDVYPHLAEAIAANTDELKKYPASRAIFLNKKDLPLKVGDRLVQTDLAKTLRAIAEKGHAGFYKGWVAKALVDQQIKLKGLIRQNDLDRYNVVMRKPVTGQYRGYTIHSMPPPSSGGIHVLQILNMLEPFKLRQVGRTSAKAIHLTSAAMQMAFADRAKYLGDADFVKVPTAGLIDKKYAAQLMKSVRDNVARPSKLVKEGKPAGFHESSDTTHFTIMDHQGNTVASTQTINGWLGSAVVVPGTGIVLNNEMDDFSAKPGAPNLFGVLGGQQNAIQPEKRPLSSMSPTIVMQDGRPMLALGSPSGPRILTCVMHTVLNYLEYQMGLYDAVSATRYHHQWYPDQIRVGEPFFAANTEKSLEQMGYEIHKKNLRCSIQAVAWEKGKLHAVSDPRGTGLATGG